MTRSGQIYGPEPQKKDDVVAKDKGKVLVESSQEQEPPNQNFTNQEAEKFLKIIKKSNYRVVDQLHQSPTKISIPSFLINSEAHRDSLMKVLSSAHVAEEITVNQFDNVVANLTSRSYIGVVTGLKMRVATHNFYLWEVIINDNPNMVSDSKLLVSFLDEGMVLGTPRLPCSQGY